MKRSVVGRIGSCLLAVGLMVCFMAGSFTFFADRAAIKKAYPEAIFNRQGLVYPELTKEEYDAIPGYDEPWQYILLGSGVALMITGGVIEAVAKHKEKNNQ